MELFRISLDIFADALTTSNKANRWNADAQSVLYAGSSRSLATLELVVHRAAIQPANTYKVMVISVTDEDRLITQIHTQDLPADWRTMAAYSTLQQIGAAWYTAQTSLLLKVPSAVIVQEYNYLINVNHPDFKANVTLVRSEEYFWDDRLLS